MKRLVVVAFLCFFENMNLQGLIGKKSYQSQGFLEDGTRIPVSAVAASDNFISQVKSQDKEGYNSVQIAFGSKKKTTKALEGHGKKAGLEKTARFFREIRVEEVSDFTPGTKIEVSEVFKPGDIVDVSGVSKGKGWAGVVKKWHFRGGPRTHGQSDRERAPGSIGQTTTPGRVYKGKKMGGKMGHVTSTVRNLEVIEVTNDGVILIKGLIPGHINGLVMIKKVGENKKFVPLYKEVEEEKQAEPQKEVQAAEPVLEEDGSRPSVSDDAQSNEEKAQAEEPASLSDSQQTVSEEIAENTESAVSSSDNGQTPTVSSEEPVREENKEKEEVNEDAK